MRRLLAVAALGLTVTATAGAALTAQPNDQYLARQWYLGRDHALDTFDAAKQLFTVRVAVIDSGVELGHPELKNRVVAHRSPLDPMAGRARRPRDRRPRGRPPATPPLIQTDLSCPWACRVRAMPESEEARSGLGQRGVGEHGAAERVLQEEPPHGLGPEGGVDVALARGHDRALHEDVPLAGEGLGLGHAGVARQVREEGPNVGQLLAAGLVERGWRIELLRFPDRFPLPEASDLAAADRALAGLADAPRLDEARRSRRARERYR